MGWVESTPARAFDTPSGVLHTHMVEQSTARLLEEVSILDR